MTRGLTDRASNDTQRARRPTWGRGRRPTWGRGRRPTWGRGRRVFGTRAAQTGLLGLALLGAGLAAGSTAAVAGATTSGSATPGATIGAMNRPGWATAPLSVPTSSGPSRGGHALAASPNVSNPNICWSQTEGDPAGDATSLDLVSGTLEYDCSSKLLTISARTAARFATPSVHDFFAAFDTDDNASTGCGGSDLYADAAWVPARNEMEAAIFTVAELQRAARAPSVPHAEARRRVPHLALIRSVHVLPALEQLRVEHVHRARSRQLRRDRQRQPLPGVDPELPTVGQQRVQCAHTVADRRRLHRHHPGPVRRQRGHRPVAVPRRPRRRRALDE